MKTVDWGRPALRRLLYGLVGGVVLLLVWQIWLSWTATPSVPVRPEITASSSSPTNWSLNWLGEGGAGTGSGASLSLSPSRELEEASLNGSLLGVLVSSTNKYIVYQAAGGQEKVFRVGDEIQPGVILIDVQPTRAIVRQRGSEQQITLQRAGGEQAPVRRLEGVVSQNDDNAIQLSLPELFSAESVNVDEGKRGLQVGNISDNLAGETTIQPGDVIVSVAGQPVGELMNAPERLLEHSTNTSLPVTVRRDGRPVDIYVNAMSLSARLMPALGNTPDAQGN